MQKGFPLGTAAKVVSLGSQVWSTLLFPLFLSRPPRFRFLDMNEPNEPESDEPEFDAAPLPLALALPEPDMPRQVGQSKTSLQGVSEELH